MPVNRNRSVSKVVPGLLLLLGSLMLAQPAAALNADDWRGGWRLHVEIRLERLLADVNAVLLDLRKPGMFVTGAFLAGALDGAISFSLAGLKALLAEHGRQPLGEIRNRVFDAVRLHGPQLDDQSLLLVCRVA
jgi:hypothetical protein